MAHESEHVPGTISNLQVLAHVSALDALGIDTNRVLHAIGLTRASCADPAGRIAAGIEFVLWDAALAVSGDPEIGLRVGQQLSYDALGGYGYLLLNSATLRQQLERADKYMRLIDDLARIEFSERGDRVVVRVFRSGGYPIPGPAVDCLFAAITSVTRQLHPELDFTGARVRIAHASALDVETYERYFGWKVEFGAEHEELDLPRELIDQPLPLADPKLGDVLQDHATLLLANLPEADALVQNARTLLTAQLGAGDSGLTTLARALHMSERTLRRRLAERGTSYQALLDELRSSIARKLVESGTYTLDQIAQRLGFADTSSFFHAFKRWTGKTPAQHRREERKTR